MTANDSQRFFGAFWRLNGRLDNVLASVVGERLREGAPLAFECEAPKSVRT